MMPIREAGPEDPFLAPNELINLTSHQRRLGVLRALEATQEEGLSQLDKTWSQFAKSLGATIPHIEEMTRSPG